MNFTKQLTRFFLPVLIIAIVFVTPSGIKYHSCKTCGGKNSSSVSLKYAQNKYKPCKKCY